MFYFMFFNQSDMQIGTVLAGGYAHDIGPLTLTIFDFHGCRIAAFIQRGA